ncbi:MAG: ferritin-like domain-containing protein [Hyphomicrobiaceae bacterium]
MSEAQDNGPAAETWQPDNLIQAAASIVTACEPMQKVTRAKATRDAWLGGRLSIGSVSTSPPMPDRPGRPAKPDLVAPRHMPRRSAHGLKGRIALLHSLAHIELNAVDMTWDLIGRFGGEDMPRAFLDDWVTVGGEEAEHFALVSNRLNELGAAYGDLPAHDGLWQAAQATGHSLVARIAVVPLVLEARGLDVSPSMIDQLQRACDDASAAVLNVIYQDEKRHVAFGARWFRFLCKRDGLPPEPTFHALVRRHFRGPVKPPFNDRARAEAGLTPGFYKPLVGAVS